LKTSKTALEDKGESPRKAASRSRHG
jgi:hypothetical protein